MKSKKKVVNNNIPPNPKGWATWPKYVPARNRRCLNASSKRNVVLGTTFGLFSDAHVCTSTSWPTFTPPQPISGVISAFSKHKREKETWWRGGGEEGRWESRWATPRPHVPALSGKDRLCLTKTAALVTPPVFAWRVWALATVRVSRCRIMFWFLSLSVFCLYLEVEIKTEQTKNLQKK